MRLPAKFLLLFLAGCVAPVPTGGTGGGSEIVVGPAIRVLPATIAFGLIGATTRTLMISNVGGSPLKLGKFEVAAMNPQTSVSEFALMTGGYNDAEGIEPGGSLEIEVRFTPSSKGFKFVELRIPSNDLSAPETAIAIRASSESKDLLQFPVSANSNPPCLRITPDDHNFGTVQGQCSSAARTFAISNTCSSAVTVKSVETIFPAGEPAGSAHCPGTLACPEFVVVDSSEVAPGTVISAGSTPRILKLQYRPLNVGPDVGAIELRVRQFGETVDALITLSGTGDAPPRNDRRHI